MSILRNVPLLVYHYYTGETDWEKMAEFMKTIMYSKEEKGSKND